MANTKEQAAEKPTVKISIKEVLSMLNNGQDRRTIAAHYGISLATINEVFKSTPKLKGARVKPRTPVEVIDDTEDTTTSVVSSPAAETKSTADAVAPAGAQAAKQQEAAPVAATADSAKGVW